MKKSRLILENGQVINGEFSGSENILGQVNLGRDGHLCISCLNMDNRTYEFIPEDSLNQRSLSELKEVSHKPVLGKVVVDTLSVDFHLHDLKTTL